MHRIIKVTLLSLIGFHLLYFGFIVMQGTLGFEYGNHLILENPNGWRIDSVNIQVCKYECTFTNGFHSSNAPEDPGLAGNIDPKDDKDGCAVIFTVYHSEGIRHLPANLPFDCSGCDINHYYLLTDSMAYALPWDYPYWRKDSFFMPPQ